ncbi:MAG: FAD-dependent oxidoreductase [Verrucomicrobia bacterium]|nr:FAD-dependent oxidoreductase [Verrucomicrobiota bacterium]
MRLLLALGLLSLARPAQAAEADVIVYGATPGGFCAAIAAAREGAKVVLLEPTAHVGGVNTGGLSFSDSNQTVRSTLLGLFEEWHRRIAADYAARGVKLPYDVAVKDNSVWTYEPHVAARVTGAMLKEAGVTVLTKQILEGVEKDGAKIVGLRTSGGIHVAKVFIDATYEGDLMARAGVVWHIGRESRDEHGESFAGRQYPKEKMAINGFDANGLPLPFITSLRPGDDQAGEETVMVYSFRLCLTKNPANRVPFPEPKAYDPARFELVRRYFQKYPSAPVPWDLYPLPGDKFDANNGIGKMFSMGMVGEANGWCASDPAGRERLWEKHKQYTLEFYKFLTTDEAVPAKIRTTMAELGLCRDEFPETGHWSPQLYVREGRRMDGRFMLTQKDVLSEPQKDDAIAVSTFPIDSHDCRRLALPDGVINEGTIFPVRMPGRRHGYAYHIPYRAITPSASECSNLLVPVALSATHVAYSSIRVEPTWMAIGQSAGVAAALAAKAGVSVQTLDYPSLRARLLARNVVLELPKLPPLPAKDARPSGPVSLDPKSLPGLILDDAQAELSGDWERSANFKPYVGTGYLHDGQRSDGKSRAVFRFKVPADGDFELRMAYSAHETRTTRLPVTIAGGGAEHRLTVDQTQPLPSGQAFREVGRVRLSQGVDYSLTVTNQDTRGFVILDAFQLLPAVAPAK